jgi:signal transduction histidine kinase/ActR/RegA family two-component response regulator
MLDIPSKGHTNTNESAGEGELAVARDELPTQVEGLTSLHELAMRLGGISEIQPALEAILDTAIEGQDAHFGLMWLHDPGTDALVVRASRGFPDALLEEFARIVPGPAGGAAGNAFARRSRWVIEDIESDPSFIAYRDTARRAGIRAVHSTPIVTRAGELLGVISVHYRQPRRPTRRDMQMADVCARYAADAIKAYLDIARLREAESDLRELDQRKNEFLATLAHELRNPLAPLRNGLEVMRLAGTDSLMAGKARAMMERQLGQMVRLVDDLLDVSRVSRGKIELRREEVDLAAVLRSAIETSQPLMDERGHEFVADIPDAKIAIHGDFTRLAQVFANLLNNAAKYTPGGGRVTLEVKPRDREVAVTVRDNGLGIPADMATQVFDIFTQVDRSFERMQGGLGIGLSIAKRLVEMHGGTIELASEGVGLGSAFTVLLPARIEGSESPHEAPRRRVLVADDNCDAATTLAMILEMLGNEVRVAHDGEQAVSVAAEFHPDAILLDIGMPRLDGYGACQRIRLLPGMSAAFIVALTGWGHDDDKDRARAAGFDRHLVKPVDPEALQQLIAAVPVRQR